MASSSAAAAAFAVFLQCISLVYSFNGALLPRGRPGVGIRRPPPTSHAHDFGLSPSSSSLPRRGPAALSASADDEATNDDEADTSIDVSADPRLRRLRLSRALGIDWGTDLSFSFVYVRDLEPSGAAAISGEVESGDQICELRPVSEGGEAINLIGAPFDEVMGAFASLDRKVTEVELVFFRGTKEELKELCAGGSQSQEAETITITVIQNKGSKDEATKYIEAKAGCNVRQVLTDNGINVYQSVTRWTNCKGKQLCGTCIVNVAEGAESTNRKSLDEASTLRENPEGYRLSCVTFAYGDVTVETFPPIKAAQWTR
ncbi:hypothetical protein ACHAXT_007120 [Thalassiosira profunda]